MAIVPYGATTTGNQHADDTAILGYHVAHRFLVGVEEDDVLFQTSGCHTNGTHLHRQLRVYCEGHKTVMLYYMISGDHHVTTHIHQAMIM